VVNISTNTKGSVNVSARDSGSVNVNNNTKASVDADTNGNAQRAKSWAVGTGLIDGEDYSAKYWAGQAKESEEIATGAVGEIETAKDEALGELETAKDEKIGEINSTATTFETQLTEIKNAAEDAAHDAFVSEGNAQESATTAQNAASTATTAVTTVTQAVSTATTAATQATQAAQTAQYAASDAQSYKNDAKNYATRAGRDADTAQSAAYHAQQAMTTATTAATQATDARDYVVNALSNYYTKSETYTKTEVQQLIASLPEFTVEVVEELPATGEAMVLYLVPKDGEDPDVYNEYVWVEDDNDFELIGNTAVDLSDYVTTSTLTTTLTDYVTSTTLTTTLTNYVTASTLTTTLTDYVETTTLATVATSGAYSDLTGTPTIPSKTSDLNNDSGFITSSDLPTNHVTTDTAQDISGRKTFIGEKAIYFKQSAAADKLGFTLYNASSTELAALEYRPNTINGASLLALNCPQTTGGYVGFRYWGTPAVNVVAPKVATAGNYFIPTHITNGTLTVTANTTGTIDISTLLPDVSNFVTNSSLSTTLADYVLSSSLATVATTGAYSDLIGTPTIPTVNNATITFTQGGTTKGTITLNQSSDATIALDAGGSSTSIPNPAYGTSSTAAATAQKVVSIPEITELNVGQVIMIRPSTTSTVANSTIKLNSFDAYPMRYNNAAISTSTDSTVWGANFISSFMFDGTYWQFIGHGIDSNTTYSNMSVSEGTTGTATSARTMRADYLKQIIQGTKLTGLDTSDNTAVEATDSILTGIGKLQAETESAYNKAVSKADWFEIGSPLTSTYDNTGIVFGGDCYITSDGILKGDTAWNDGIMDAVTSVNLINDYWEWNGYFKFTSISAEEELIAVDGVNDNGFLFHIKPNGDVINPDDNNKVLANVYANDWVGFNVVHQAGDTDITVTLDTANGKVTTTTALATTTAQAIHNTCWHCNNSYGIEFLVRNDESWWKKSAGGTFNTFVTRHLGADLSSKQDALVSGTNIKTINYTSLLGSGNIDTSEIFVATYGTTTYADVLTAYNAGKTIVCKDSSNIIANLIFYNTGNSFTFATGVSNNNAVEFNVLANNTWTTKYYYLADTDLSNLSATGQAVIDAKVNKSGDTMTGELNITNASGLTIINDAVTKGTAPSSTTWRHLQFVDSANVSGDWGVSRLGILEQSINDNGSTSIFLSTVQNVANSTNRATLTLTMTSAGVASCTFPNTTCVDGQWVYLNQRVINSATSLVGTTPLGPYTVNVPNDGHKYELLLETQIYSDNAVGNFCYLKVNSSEFGIILLQQVSDRASSNWGVTSGTTVLGTNRQLTVSRSNVNNFKGYVNYLTVVAYRRIGTNS
jgi:hypothetical protein